MVEVGILSPTKITTYMGCGLSYYLQYVAHEKIASNVRLVFGKEIHHMLEQFYKKNFKSEDSFVNSWKYRWFSSISGDFLKGKQKRELQVKEIKTSENFTLKIGDHVDLEDWDPVATFFGYKSLGEKILRRFYQRHKDKDPPLYIEYPFGIKKDKPVEIYGHKIRGIFDRIDFLDKKWYITDYKTDKSSPEKDSFTLHRYPQFTLYSNAFGKIFGEKEEAILYYHLRSGRVFKTHRSEKDYEYLKKLLDSVSEGISKDIFVPFYGFHCNFCRYKVPCERYSIPYHGGPRIDLEKKIIGAETFKKWDAEVPNWMEMIEE